MTASCSRPRPTQTSLQYKVHTCLERKETRCGPVHVWYILPTMSTGPTSSALLLPAAMSSWSLASSHTTCTVPKSSRTSTKRHRQMDRTDSCASHLITATPSPLFTGPPAQGSIPNQPDANWDPPLSFSYFCSKVFFKGGIIRQQKSQSHSTR